MFPKEIIIMITEFIYDFKTFKNLRLTNKYYYDICMRLWNNLNINLNFYPKLTFVNIKKCMVCKNHICSINKLYIKYKPYPWPVYIFCNKLKCVNSVITHYFYVSHKNNIIYLYNIKENENNTNKKKELCKYFKIINYKIYIHNEYIKNRKFYFKNNLIDKKKYKLLSWYRNFKDFKINKIKKILE